MRKRIIGRQEVVSLPSLKLKKVNAKIDTGAYTSSLHCKKTEIIVQDDVEILRIHLDNKRFKDLEATYFDVEKYSIVQVRSSNGVLQKRYKFKTEMSLGGKTYKLAFTLANRSKMEFPILLGRKFLTNKFIVDVSLANHLNTENEHSSSIKG